MHIHAQVISILHHHYVGHHENGDYVPTDFFETAAMLITLIALGKYLESAAKGRTSQVGWVAGYGCSADAAWVGFMVRCSAGSGGCMCPDDIWLKCQHMAPIEQRGTC